MNSSVPAFREPTRVEKFFHRAMGFPVGLGLAPAHMRLLEVRGRKSGMLYTTPVDLLELNGKQGSASSRLADAPGGCAMRRLREKLF